MNKRGSVLMISLWILAILVIFALGLGHRASINLRLAKYQKDRLKATCLAKAGINRAIVELERDDNEYDSLDETWSTGKDANNNNIFENIEIQKDSGETFIVKIPDEKRKLNVNRITPQQLQQLFIHVEFAEQDALDLTNIISEWISTEKETDENKIIFKNELLKKPEELLLILEYFYQLRGKLDKSSDISQDTYKNIKDLITVYGDGKININTAEKSLTPLALSIAKDNSIEENFAISLVQQIIDFANGQQGPFKNQTDIENFSPKEPQENTIFGIMKGYLTVNSNYFKIESQGKVGNITKNITAIYDRDNDSMVYWHEN